MTTHEEYMFTLQIVLNWHGTLILSIEPSYLWN